jgi:hypothetical protein
MNLLDNKLVWLVAFMTVFNVGMFLGFKVLVNKTADQVIQKLQKDYSPSPYGPGFDPDKVSPDSLRRKEVLFYEGQGELLSRDVTTAEIWQSKWEMDRASR